MKKKIFALCIGSLLLILTASETKAQFSVNINIGTQPAWGPAGYQRADYYYLPDIESYYSVSNHQFIYLSNGRWVFAANLPPQYGDYDLYSGYKVVVNRPRPYLNFREDRVQYGRYKGWKEKQYVLGDRRDPRGMPPGQAKKYYNGGNGMPPGQAKKYYNGGDGMPPGQAKKYNRDNGDDRGDNQDRGNKHDNGRGHGRDRGND